MQLPDLGVGVVYVPGLEPLLEPGSSCVDVIEIEPQTLWNYDSSRSNPYTLPSRTLDYLRGLPQSKLIHSVGAGVGGRYQPDRQVVDALASFIGQVDAPWASEHLSFTRVASKDGAFDTGFMLPPMQTPAGAQSASGTIRKFASGLPVPIAVETSVNYLQPRPGELSDGEFTALTVELADCGILLDLHNLWVNERNGRQKVADFLAAIPLERVWEIHLAGGFEHEGYWLDSHSGAVPDEVLGIARDLVAHLPNLKAIVFEIFPTYVPLFGVDAVADQLEKIGTIWRCRDKEVVAFDSRPAKQPGSVQEELSERDTEVLRDWEGALAELVTFGDAESTFYEFFSKDPSIDLVERMIWRFRAGSLTKVLKIFTRYMLSCSNFAQLESLFDEYFRNKKPQSFASEEALCFIEFLEGRDVGLPYLQDILRIEACVIRSMIEQQIQQTQTVHDPVVLLDEVSKGRQPVDLQCGNYLVMVDGDRVWSEEAV